MSESAVEQNDGTAVLRAVTTVIYTRDTSRIRDKRDTEELLYLFSTPQKARLVDGSHTLSELEKETSNARTIRNW